MDTDKRQKDDKHGWRLFRRMAIFLVLLILGAIVLVLVWVKEPPATVNEPSPGQSGPSPAPKLPGRE
jgi:hypothetical protein